MRTESLFFLVEKTFTIDPVMNKQNVSEVHNVYTTIYLASVMMLGVVSSNGEKMSSVWFHTGYQLTAHNYKYILKTNMFLWIKRVFKKADYIF